jgi:predicted phage baseplate assembly protein
VEGLVWRGDPARVRSALPELLLIPQRAVPGEESEVAWEDAPEPWEWLRSPIGARPADPVFTLDDGLWRELARPGDPEPRLVDYAGDPGWTIRFTWGEFGRCPEIGTIFRVVYRLGNGSEGNLPPGAIHGFDVNDPAWASVAALHNPVPSEGGVDPETLDEVRRNAPEAYRASPRRAVRPEDYARAAEEELPWVDRAGARLRWTGSWPVLFATADPADGRLLGAKRRAELEALLERVRQTGRSIQVREPEYADLDLVLVLCVEPTAYPEEVKARVLEVLLGGEHPVLGPRAFTFGTPLRRSILEAAIMRTTGVRAVSKVTVRRRGFEAEHELGLEDFRVGENVIIRVANDPAHPDRGSVRVETRGGA